MKDSAELLTKTAAAPDQAPVPANDHRRFAVIQGTAARRDPNPARAVPATWRAGPRSLCWQPGSWGDAF